MRKQLAAIFTFFVLAFSWNARADISRGDHHDYVHIRGPVFFMNQPALQVGGFGAGDNQLGGADTVEVDRRGNIYVYDDSQGVIKVWSYTTRTGDVLEIITSASIEAAGLAPLKEVRAISGGNLLHRREATRLYVIDRDKDRTPENRILMRPCLFSQDWTELPFTDFEKTPHDLTVDIFGRLIVSEKKGRIEVLLPDGSGRDISFADDGVLELEDVEGLDASSLKTVDTDFQGNIYVADKDNGRIIKLSPAGEVLQVFGSQGDGPDQFREQVEGIAVDWQGNVYGRDESGDRYLAFAPDGTFLAEFGSRGFEPPQQENADEFTIDKLHGRFVIADNNNYRASVHKMKRRGPFLSRIFTQYDFPESPVVQPVWIAGGTQGSASGTEFDEPNELTFDRNGRLWAGDVFNYRVQIYDSDGTFATTVGGRGDGPCEFVEPVSGKSGPEAIKTDSTNNVYVVDRGGQKINVYDGTTFECVRMITSPMFDDPTGLALDSEDNLYVADQGTDEVYKLANDGTYLMTFQSLDGDGAILDKTETLALDEERDRLFASSENESRVEVFELSTGDYLGEHVGERQVGVIPQDGRFNDDVEGIAADPVNNWLVMSDEDNGRFLIHELGSSDLFDGDEDYAYMAAFGKVGSEPGEFLSADGVVVAPDLGLVAVADQGNYRIQVFRISDIKETLDLE